MTREPAETSTSAPPSAAERSLPPPSSEATPLWKRVLPFGIAIALITFVLARLDLRAFVASLARVSYVGYFAFTIAFLFLLLAADSFATAFVYRRTIAPIGFRDFFLVRGASYLPSILNHHVGQAFITYFLSKKHKVVLWRVAGATLLVYASWMGCLLGLGCVVLVATGKPALWLAAPIGAGLCYLAIIASRPTFLAKNRLLAPLFDAGVDGHLIALVVRLPHLAVLFLGTWLPFWFFGVRIPLGAAATYVPILMVATTLPITPMGFGTRDLLAAQFFERFVVADTHEQRLATIAAATASWGVAVTIVEALMGVWLMRRAMANLARVRDAERTRAESTRAET